MDVCLQISPLLYIDGKPSVWNLWAHFFKEIYCTASIHSMYKDKLQNCPVTILNKYLHYGTSGTEKYVQKYKCK